jgi:hypothetical protein
MRHELSLALVIAVQLSRGVAQPGSALGLGANTHLCRPPLIFLICNSLAIPRAHLPHSSTDSSTYSRFPVLHLRLLEPPPH